MDDLVSRGAEILDGTGADAVRADLAIREGRIVAITPGYAGTARRVIDARGSIVAPGFIDIKTHSDFTLPYAPRAESKVLQGVTTEVVGHCGFSLAPVLPGRAPILQEYLAGFALCPRLLWLLRLLRGTSDKASLRNKLSSHQSATHSSWQRELGTIIY